MSEQMHIDTDEIRKEARYYRGSTINAMWLKAHLDAALDEIDRLRVRLQMWSTDEKWFQAELSKVEQCTKEACFKAGWEWIEKEFAPEIAIWPTKAQDKELFKQAIESAEVNPAPAKQQEPENIDYKDGQIPKRRKS